MASCNLTLSAQVTAAYHELLNTAEAIKQTHGEDVAIAWAQRTFEADFDLFVRLSTEERPSLRLIEGGRR